MRTVCVLVVLWFLAFGLLVAAHDYPEQVESVVETLNETIGVALPTSPAPYELFAFIHVMVLPMLLLWITQRFSTTAKRLGQKLDESTREVQMAKGIVQGMRQSGQDVVSALEPLDDRSIMHDLAQLEQDVPVLETLVANARDAQDKANEGLPERLRSLAERLKGASNAVQELRVMHTTIQEAVQETDHARRQIMEGIESITEDDPVASLVEMNRELVFMMQRVKALEQLPGRSAIVKDGFAALAIRLEKLQEGNGIGGLIEEVQEKNKELEDALKAAGEDGDEVEFSDTVDDWESDLPDLEKRVVDLEQLLPRITAFRTTLGALNERFEKADGDEENHLPDLIEAVQEEAGDLKNSLEEAEGGEDAEVFEKVDELENELDDWQKRIEELEKLMPRVKDVQAALKALEQRLQAFQDESVTKLVASVERLKDKVGGDLDDIEAPSDSDLDALEEERDKLRDHLEESEQALRRLATVKGDMSRLQSQIDALKSQDGAIS